MGKVKTKAFVEVKGADKIVNNKALYIIISLIAILVSIIYSYKLKWLGDDIFIALRYIQNFIAGNGIVYNPGERVEGYTDFLWIIIISFFSLLKYTPEVTVLVLGILSSVGILIYYSIIGYKISRKQNVFIIPFITLSLALNYDFNVWATSGLETSFFSFLLSVAFYMCFFSNYNENKRLILTGLFLCLALMTRPDTLLIICVSNFLIAVNSIFNSKNILKLVKPLFLFNLAFIIIYIPYFLWRYNYYGFIFPNTYYDKMGYESYFSKGFYYIWLYFKPHFTCFLVFLLPPFFLYSSYKSFKNKILDVKIFINDRHNAAYLSAIIIIFAYLLGFVAKVGGDFMHARFIIALAPGIAFIIFYSVIHIVKPKNWNLVFVLLLLVSLYETKIRGDIFKGKDENGKEIITLNRDVADERYVYTSYFNVKQDEIIGKAIGRVFKGIPAKMIVKGAQARLAYYTNLYYLQEYHGLTDTAIAHAPLLVRGRIGHEKNGTLEYFERKGIHFKFNRGPFTKDQFRFGAMNIPPYSIRFEMVTYDNQIMKQLTDRIGPENIQYVDFPAYLDYYITNQLPKMDKNQLKKDYDNFYLYYFLHNNDKPRENKFLEALKK